MVSQARSAHCFQQVLQGEGWSSCDGIICTGVRSRAGRAGAKGRKGRGGVSGVWFGRREGSVCICTVAYRVNKGEGLCTAPHHVNKPNPTWLIPVGSARSHAWSPDDYYSTTLSQKALHTFTFFTMEDKTFMYTFTSFPRYIVPNGILNEVIVSLTLVLFLSFPEVHSSSKHKSSYLPFP